MFARVIKTACFSRTRNASDHKDNDNYLQKRYKFVVQKRLVCDKKKRCDETMYFRQKTTFEVEITLEFVEIELRNRHDHNCLQNGVTYKKYLVNKRKRCKTFEKGH